MRRPISVTKARRSLLSAARSDGGRNEGGAVQNSFDTPMNLSRQRAILGLSGLLCAIVGFALGWFARVHNPALRERHLDQESLEFTYAKCMECVEKLYFEESKETAVGAILLFVSTFSTDVESGLLGSGRSAVEANPYRANMALFQGRLALLFMDLGMEGRAQPYVAKAIKLYGELLPDSGWVPPVITNAGGVFEAVRDIDQAGDLYKLRL